MLKNLELLIEFKVKGPPDRLEIFQAPRFVNHTLCFRIEKQLGIIVKVNSS